jgi:hypothetical protein
MTKNELLQPGAAKLRSLDILKSSNQVNKFLIYFEGESQEVCECLADCIENHPDWLYGWLMSSEGSAHQAQMWLRFMLLTNRPSLAVDHFSIFPETKFVCQEMA